MSQGVIAIFSDEEADLLSTILKRYRLGLSKDDPNRVLILRISNVLIQKVSMNRTGKAHRKTWQSADRLREKYK